ncbi:hypothetical protein [Bernardetia litoralis]|uniref:hypothetical protein n=1 Tax=Bernardetia litoralis TaxID=999 RepID=UPI0003111FD7|nr:hypothetical protein [Bernardetia litoralis]
MRATAGHTHPKGTAYPSIFDTNWIIKNGDYNASNQKSIILPIGKQAIEFDKNTIYKE